MAWVTIETNTARRQQELSQKFYVGIVNFKHIDVLISRNKTVFYDESVLKIFTSLDCFTFVLFLLHTLLHKVIKKLQSALIER
jgi:hypothetical protein